MQDGPTCIFWANLTPSSLQLQGLALWDDEAEVFKPVYSTL
jgi:hypothetical protein